MDARIRGASSVGSPTPAEAAQRVDPRDPPTSLAYGALAAYAFWLYAFGPAVSLLRSELHFSYATVGLYSAAWSGGAVLAGLGYAQLAVRLHRRAQLWSLALLTTLAAAAFTAAENVVLTLLAALAIGTAGTALQMTTQSILSDRHRSRRGQALAQANIGAGAVAVLAPLALGGFALTPLGWRTAMALPAVAFVALYARLRAERLGGELKPARSATLRASSLSKECILLCVLVAVGIAVEFCVVYFGAELLAAADGLSAATAATALTAFYGGIFAGRIGGAGVGRARTERTLLAASIAIAVGGLLLVSLARTPGLAIGGLAIAGLGVANLFPLSVALALDTARAC